MKNLLKQAYQLILFMAIIIALFSSCRYEDIVTSPDNENSIVENNATITSLIRDIATNDGSVDNIIDLANCFRIKLPVTVIANGRTVVISSNEDLDMVRAIFEESSVDTDMVTMNFPVTAILTDYTEVMLNDENELHALAETCTGEDEEDDDIECIDFLFPINFTVFNTVTEQSNNVSIENDAELFLFVKDLSVDDVASLNFPVTLVLSDASQQTVTSLEELEILIESVKDDCDEDDDFDYLDNDFNDTQNPSTPLNLTASNIGETNVDLSWDASVDNIGVKNYEVYIDGALSILTESTSIIMNDLMSNTLYAFTVIARDAAGNSSLVSNEVSVTTLASLDVTAPSTPINLMSSNTTQTTTDLTWDAATDNIDVTGYDVYNNGALIGTTANIAYTVSGLTASTSYTFTVIAKDAAGNSSSSSNPTNVTTLALAGDTEAPSVPLNLAASNTVENIVDLTWDASTDNIGIVGYDVYMDGVLIEFVTTTTHTVPNLAFEETYDFQVLAKDAEGNSSNLSNSVSITIQSAPLSGELSVLTTCSDWTVEKLERNGDKLEDVYAGFVFNFFTDGTISVFDGSTTYSGTWIQVGVGAGTKITITIPTLPDFNLVWDLKHVHDHSDRRDIEFTQGTQDKLKFETPCN